MIEGYKAENFFDEMINATGLCRDHYEPVKNAIEAFGKKKLQRLQHSTDKAQMSMGMTFNVYHDRKGMEKIL